MFEFTEKKLVVATHNKGKAKEIADLLTPYNIEVITASSLGLPEPEETGATFEENAALKAVAAATKSGLWALSDDSGLSVAALDGAPGIYSARWAGPDRDFYVAMEKVQNELEGKEDRSAEFVCVLSLSSPEGDVQSFEGRVKGDFVWPPRGDQGFGYDPVFVPKGYQETFGEMEPAFKHSISHRAQAFELFKKSIAFKTSVDKSCQPS